MNEGRRLLRKIGFYGKKGERRKIVRELNRVQNGKCAMCGTNGYNKLEVDHIVKFSDGGQHEMKNMQLLCTECHDLKDNQQKRVRR